MEDKNHAPETEDDVVDKALELGMLGFLILLLGTSLLEGTGYLPQALRIFPYALTAFALLGVAWLLWKSPIIED